jgi:hypothetical protein
MMAERVAVQQYPCPVGNLVYPGAGHAIAPPMIEGFHLVAKRMYALGGTPAAGAHANADHWPRVVRFLTESLRF